MYAIVNVAGQQFKVETGQKIYVHRLAGNEGAVVDFDQVLLIDQGEKILVGEPVLKGARVTAKILAHPRGDKVMVFKKKRRKGYEVLKGHRQDLTFLQIESIDEKAPERKTTPAAATTQEGEISAPVKAEKKIKPKASVKQASATKQSSASTKKTAVAKTTTKKATATKPAAKKTPTVKKKTAVTKPAAKAAAKKPAVNK